MLTDFLVAIIIVLQPGKCVMSVIKMIKAINDLADSAVQVFLSSSEQLLLLLLNIRISCSLKLCGFPGV